MNGLTLSTPVKRGLAELLFQGQKQAYQANKPLLVSLSRPINSNVNPQSLFSASRTGDSLTFWAKPDKDFWLVGKGSAARLIFHGPSAMCEAAREYNSLVKTALIEAPDVRGVGPVALGGFRFDTESRKARGWRSYPDAMLVIPQLLFTHSAASTWLTVNAIVAPGTDVVTQAEALTAELQAEGLQPQGKNHQPVVTRVVQDLPEQYSQYVRSALEAIKEGQLTKVVLARRKILHADGQFSLDNALGYLYSNYPDCSIFAIKNSGVGFFGATPESLVGIDQGRLDLTCLAGSAARGNTLEEDTKLEKELMGNPKERAEHAAVTALVTASLKDLCQELLWDNKPRILKLRNVQHLLTSVTGSLNHGNSILDVVKRLHPTPAVAGVPTEQAMSFIRNSENDRGWYAAPVGWVDHNGGGEFAVGIRSALLDGNRAVLYAGAGIVRGSDPDREFQETELKFQPLMAALTGSQ